MSTTLESLKSMDHTFRPTLESHTRELQGWVRDWPRVLRDIKEDLDAFHTADADEQESLDMHLAFGYLQDLQRALSNAAEDLGNYADDVERVLNEMETEVHG